VEIHLQINSLSGREFKSPYEYINAIGQPIAGLVTSAHFLPESNGLAKDGRRNIADLLFGGCLGSLVFFVEAQFVHFNKAAEFRITGYYEEFYSVLYGSSIIAGSLYGREHSPIKDSLLAKYAFDINDTDGKPLVSQAKRYAVGYIEACCSPTARQLDPEKCKGIGGHIHVATVKPRSGFEWVIAPKDAPLRYPDPEVAEAP
jgi:hypothetical protein